MDERNFRTVSVGDFRPPKINFGMVGLLILVLVLAMLVWSTVFTIKPEEVGVVQTFGKFSRVASPGLQFKLPAPIQMVTKVPVERQLKEEFGFRTLRAGVRSSYDKREFLEESLMLTGDLNVGEVEWSVQFRVSDPYPIFGVR